MAIFPVKLISFTSILGSATAWFLPVANSCAVGGGISGFLQAAEYSLKL
jgi:hypothetical protein